MGRPNDSDVLIMYTWSEDGLELYDPEETREFVKEWMPDIPTFGRYIVYSKYGILLIDGSVDFQ